MSNKKAKLGKTRKTGRMYLHSNPPKPELNLAQSVVVATARFVLGLDGKWRCWDAEGHRITTSDDIRLMIV
jgi:hypothetical protein